MIKVNVDTKALGSLIQGLKSTVKLIDAEANDTTRKVHKEVAVEYSRSVNELVYNKYNPVKYERTGHLANDAKMASIEKLSLKKLNKSMDFEIDNNSTDPRDGKAWAVKAGRVEGELGKKIKGVPPRPFIDQTQLNLEKKTEEESEKFVTEANRLLDRLVK